MDKSKPYRLIVKLFKKQSSNEEAEALQKWCEENAANKKEFLQLRKIWNLSDPATDHKIRTSKDSVWNGIQKNMDTCPTNLKPRGIRFNLFISYRIAAIAILVILAVAIYCICNAQKTDTTLALTTITMPLNQQGKICLNDHSVVWLNSGSKISFDSRFNSCNRKIYLEGEACFDVAKSTKHTFTVSTPNNIDVVVHGTRFDVKAYRDQPVMNVTLIRGSVSLNKAGSNTPIACLRPNQTAAIACGQKISINPCDALAAIQWIDADKKFEYMSPSEIFKQIEQHYHIRIKLTNTFPNTRYRFKIGNATLEDILKAIDQITPIEYKIAGKEVTITAK